ncbi:alpha/beta fold hydrolase [Corynebacterium sp. NPDC060344]|uniref:alpha/beta fold hydrolase n=1 Tax=Corynebacterium sp. NPDC060344 TaxID=3347101 RepID=UPI00365E15BB
MDPSTNGRFSVPGAELATEFSDEGGHPVVQLHGLTSSRARDRLLNLDLGRGLHGTRLLRYDARGHGESTGRPVAEDYRWPNLAEDLLLLLDEWFPGERVHGVGPSMGCATMLHAALLDPGRFAGFTLMAPPTAWASRIAKAADYERTADLVEKHGVDALLAIERDHIDPPAIAGNPPTRPHVAPALMPWVFRGAAMSDLPAQRALTTIDAPTTLLAWTEDPAHPLTTAQALAKLLPNSVLHVASTRAEVDRWPGILLDDVTAIGEATERQ